MNLILVGLPMSGKTTIGKMLAEKIKQPFIDTDELITQAYAKKAGNILSPRQIFALEGEKFFRSLEKLQVSSLAHVKNSVIAIGGGSLLDSENKRELCSIGVLIYLKTIPSLLWKRTCTCGVPAFLDPYNSEKAFYALSKKREPLYEAAATIIIDVGYQSKEEIVKSIIREICHGK